jgi:hypothetical protein
VWRFQKVTSAGTPVDQRRVKAMGLRQKLNENKGLSVAIAIAVILIAGAVLFWPSSGQMGFYSTDDGKTFFEHAVTVPPFSYRGSEAVQAAVVTCDGGKTKFVGWLTKFKDEPSRKAAEKAIAARNPVDTSSVLIKKPGEGDWVPMGASGPQAMMQMAPPTGPGQARPAAAPPSPAEEIAKPKCPDGSRAKIVTAGIE